MPTFVSDISADNSVAVDVLTDTQGSIAYHDGTSWKVLTPGTNGYYLRTNGAAANPTWDAPYTGPADDAITNAKLANMAQYTLKMRNTSGTGDPEDVDPNSLTEESSPASTDVVIVRTSAGLRKVQIANLASGGGGTVQGTGVNTYNIRATDDGSLAGNARGENSVDLQTSRTVNTQVASGPSSAVLSGDRNTASNINAVALGGFANTASGQRSLVFGNSSTATATDAVTWGNTNTNSGPYSSCMGGNSHTLDAAQYSAIIVGRGHELYNTSTRDSVLLGGSFNVIGSGSYTGYGSVIAGGNGNVISDGVSTTQDDFYGFIGGGYANVVGGSNSAIIGSDNSTVDVSWSCFIGGGTQNTISSTSANSACVGGDYSQVFGGAGAVCLGSNIRVGRSVSNANRVGGAGCVYFGGNTEQTTLAGNHYYSFATRVERTTANSTTTPVLWADNAAYFQLDNNETLHIKAYIVAVCSDNNESASYEITAIYHKNSTGTVTQKFESVTSTHEDADWTCATAIQPTNAGVVINVTGELTSTIVWAGTVIGTMVYDYLP